MGYIVPGICQIRKVGSPTQKTVLMALASYAWDDGSSIWVSKATLAADLEMGHRTVQEAIKGLIEKGLLVVVGEREVLHGFTVEYRIDLDAVEALPPTRDPRKKTYKNGCSSRTPSATTGAGNSSNGCSSRTQLSNEYIKAAAAAPQASESEQQQSENSGLSQGFLAELHHVLGIAAHAPGKWWAGPKAEAHIKKWRALGLSEDQILAVARKSREAHDTPPEGPKGLDAAMSQAAAGRSTADAEAPQASPDAILAFWSDKIRNAPFVAASAVKIDMANELLRRGMVTVEDLRRRSIAFTAAPAARRTAA